MLILDGHTSYISTAAIEFCISQNIILLCLPAHTTHLLQPLDVGVFAPLATAYQNHVQRTTRLGASYSIDKVGFSGTLPTSADRVGFTNQHSEGLASNRTFTI